MEIWRNVKGFEGLYKVSNLGRVYGIKSDTILKPYKDQKGYLRANLSDGVRRKNARIHQLVGMVFIDNPHNYTDMNHKDENKTNNRVENLEWCDTAYNNKYGTARLRASKAICKKVGQYDLDGNLIKEWDSLSATKLEGYNISTISSCCTGRPHYHTHKGYIWKFI